MLKILSNQGSLLGTRVETGKNDTLGVGDPSLCVAVFPVHCGPRPLRSCGPLSLTIGLSWLAEDTWLGKATYSAQCLGVKLVVL